MFSSSTLLLLLSPVSTCSSLILYCSLFCFKSLLAMSIFSLSFCFWLWVSYIQIPAPPPTISDLIDSTTTIWASAWKAHDSLPSGRVKLLWSGSYSFGFTPVSPAGLFAVSLSTLRFLLVCMINHERPMLNRRTWEEGKFISEYMTRKSYLLFQKHWFEYYLRRKRFYAVKPLRIQNS